MHEERSEYVRMCARECGSECARECGSECAREGRWEGKLREILLL